MTDQTLLGDRYQLDKVIGRGGMAEVWLAHDTRLGRKVAIKRLRIDLANDPTFQARFRREAQSAAGMNHPNIVSVYDTGEEVDANSGIAVPYIVMELVEGHTLKEVLRDDRRILPERALEFTQGVLDALSYSHKAGIVHRDIKPANVMLTPSGSVKVMDFGIARAVADTAATMTQTAAVIGTAQYLSPEQARGETVDARSDIYSAGCLLYELLVGRPPFIGDSPVSVAYQHVRETPTAPSVLDPEITPAMDAVTLKSLAKDPADRYQSAREMRDDITRVLEGVTPLAASGAKGAASGATGVASAVSGGGVGSTPTALTAVAGSAAAATLGNTALSQPVAGGDTGMTQVVTKRALLEPDEPKKRRTGLIVFLSLLALLVIGGGSYYGWTMSRQDNTTPKVAVPRVVGYNQTVASGNLTDAGLVPVIVTTNGASETADQVIKSNPTTGTMVDPGSKVTITVNLGPKTATIPSNLVGMTEAAATKALKDLGLGVTVQTSTNEQPTDKKGTVTDCNPPAGQSVTAGSTVTIYVATGSADVPNLSNMTLDQARSYALTFGFSNVTVSSTQQSTATPGTIISQDPQPGESWPKSQAITVVIAKAAPTSSTTTTTTSPATSATSQTTTTSTTTGTTTGITTGTTTTTTTTTKAGG